MHKYLDVKYLQMFNVRSNDYLSMINFKINFPLYIFRSCELHMIYNIVLQRNLFYKWNDYVLNKRDKIIVHKYTEIVKIVNIININYLKSQRP